MLAKKLFLLKVEGWVLVLKNSEKRRLVPKKAQMQALTRRERLKSALYLRLKKRKRLVLEKTCKFSFKKSCIVPKNVKGGPFGIY